MKPCVPGLRMANCIGAVRSSLRSVFACRELHLGVARILGTVEALVTYANRQYSMSQGSPPLWSFCSPALVPSKYRDPWYSPDKRPCRQRWEPNMADNRGDTENGRTRYQSPREPALIWETLPMKVPPNPWDAFP